MLKYVMVFRTSERGADEVAVALKDRGNAYWLTTFKAREETQARNFAHDVDEIIAYQVHQKANNLEKKIRDLKKKYEEAK